MGAWLLPDWPSRPPLQALCSIRSSSFPCSISISSMMVNFSHHLTRYWSNIILGISMRAFLYVITGMSKPNKAEAHSSAPHLLDEVGPIQPLESLNRTRGLTVAPSNREFSYVPVCLQREQWLSRAVGPEQTHGLSWVSSGLLCTGMYIVSSLGTWVLRHLIASQTLSPQCVSCRFWDSSASRIMWANSLQEIPSFLSFFLCISINTYIYILHWFYFWEEPSYWVLPNLEGEKRRKGK